MPVQKGDLGCFQTYAIGKTQSKTYREVCQDTMMNRINSFITLQGAESSCGFESRWPPHFSDFKVRLVFLRLQDAAKGKFFPDALVEIIERDLREKFHAHDAQR